MSVTSSLIPTCPSCQTDLSPESQMEHKVTYRICLNCGRQLENPSNKHFWAPDYLFHQKNSLMEELERSKLKPGDSQYDQKIQAIQQDLTNWARDCSTDDKIAALFDAAVIIENILFTVTPSQDFKSLIATAKRIGELANTIEQYLKARGATYDRKARSLRPDLGENSWDQATATAGGNSR